MFKDDPRFLIDDQGRTGKKLKPLYICPTLRREMHGNEPRVVEPIDFIPSKVNKRYKEDEKLTITKLFTYVSLFSGVGGFEQALNKLGGKCVMASEIDKWANLAYETLYGHKTVGDITKVKAEDVPDHDLLVGGFPCFPAGQRVITKNGFKNIEDIKAGDYVLTHKGRYREVVTPMDKLYNGDLYEITMKYYRLPIKVTSEHPFFTKRGWVDAKDLTENDYVGFPLNKKSDLPVQLKYRKKINQSKEIEVTTSLPYEKEAFWKLVGYWLADGWTQDKRKKRQGIRRAYRVLFAMNETKEKFLIPLLDELKINYSVTHERTCKRVHVTNQELWLFIKQFTKGNRASDKFLPEFVHDLPINLAKSLIEGYKAGDGATVNGYTQFTSTSVELLEGLQRLFLKTDKRLYSLHQSHKAGKATIEGREVNVKDCFMLRGGETQGHCVEFTDDYVFIKVDKIKKEKVENLPVYNIEVEEDNSYCLPLVAVHNCQAFSVAGKRLGFEDTRGTLFFEIARIAKVKRPKAMLLENVKGLVSHDKGKTLNTIIQTLCDIGYTVDFEVLNSKYFGVPQNRERVFIIAIRDDLITPEPWNIGKRTDVVAKGKRRISQIDGVKTFNFDWPPQTEVTTRLRDILEDNVDEKYYLSEEKTAKLIAQLAEKEPPKDSTDCEMVGLLDMKGQESIRRVYTPTGVAPTVSTCQGGHREPKIAVEYNRKTGIGKELDVAHTVNHSDWRGLNRNQTQNAVLEEVRPVLTPDREEKRQNGRRFKEDGEEAFTLTAQDRHGVAIGTPPRYRIRKLTPRECFRLQGFPDSEFDKLVSAGISNSQLYKMAGNAVTVNVIEAIGERLIPLITEVDAE
jgi:DNA (cytosine-5)-methyltransferase 1